MADIAGPYSSLKILHHPERIAALKRGEQIVPAQVQLILAGWCQHDCSFCAFRWSGYSSNEMFVNGAELSKFGTNNPMRFMPTEKAIELIDDCAEMGVGAIQYTGGGESTTHKDHVTIMRHSLDKGLDCALVTNGEIFRNGHIENLLRFKWVRFSIDAATPETYGAIRRISPERMHRTIDNIRNLVQARKETVAAGIPCDVIIGIGFVVTKDNWREVYPCAELAKSIGVDNIRISAVFQPDDEAYFAEFHKECYSLCKQAESIGDKDFRVFNNFAERYQDLAEKSPDHPFCGYQQFVVFVGDDMWVNRCCVLAYSERGRIGSIKDQRFKDLWESEEKKRKIADFDARGCERCMFNSRLKTILYAIDDKPMHTNFV